MGRWRWVGEWLAVGGATLLLFPLSWLLRAHLGLDAAELAVGFTMFHAAHVINDPHFAVTYVIFYRDMRAQWRDRSVGAAQRLRYAMAGVWVPLLLASWAAIALAMRSAQALGWMAQLMFLLVGWHYSKQGWGVLSVLSARRGVAFTTAERHVVLAHCYAAWAFAWASPARVAGQFEEKGVVYWAPAHPAWLEHAAGGVFALSTVALVLTLVRKWRSARALPTMPLIAFVITIWLWTIYTALDPLVRYMIPALHSIQYLYFVWLLRRNEARAHEGPPWFGPPVATALTTLTLCSLLLGWVLFRGVPSLLDDLFVLRVDAEGPLGATPFFAAIFVAVNIHHYFMDHVIWRRENPHTRFLKEPIGLTHDAAQP